MNPIIAGNRTQYEWLMKANQIPISARRMYPYVDRKQTIMALERHTTVFVYGSYLERDDWEELHHLCKYRMFLVIRIL